MEHACMVNARACPACCATMCVPIGSGQRLRSWSHILSLASVSHVLGDFEAHALGRFAAKMAEEVDGAASAANK